MQISAACGSPLFFALSYLIVYRFDIDFCLFFDPYSICRILAENRYKIICEITSYSYDIIGGIKGFAAMKNIDVLFEKNPNLKNIIVTVSASEMDDQIEFLMDLIRNSGGNELFLHDNSGRAQRITTDRIIRIQVDNKSLRISTLDGEFRLRKSMQEAENMLKSSMFLKISRFEIINLQKVKNFDFTISGQLKIEFEDGEVTWASRRYIPLIKQRLAEKRNGDQ